eukprot:4025518-Ditylum_brightwellii.AAC.1
MGTTVLLLIAIPVGTAMTISQEGIKTMISKAAAMPANLATLTSMTKEVKEATVVMIGKKKIAIVL